MGMATQNQSTPTAAVAAKSIRPASPEGKTASRVNALKTSLAARLCAIPGNDSEELQALGWMPRLVRAGQRPPTLSDRLSSTPIGDSAVSGLEAPPEPTARAQGLPSRLE